MKVAELEIGMLVEPVGDNELFRLHPSQKSQLPYITVRTGKWGAPYSSIARAQQAVYLGNRKEASVAKNDFGWSNRFVLIGGTVAAVDPAAWKRMRKVKETYEKGKI